MIKNSIF